MPAQIRAAVALALASCLWNRPLPAQEPAKAAPKPDPAAATAPAPPDWARDGVVYEVFTRNFSPEGTFEGIRKRLDHLQDLGVTTLWLMPIHPTGQKNKKGGVGSPYAVRDYAAINPEYGSPDDLKRLVQDAHARGMKVILDIVANHTAWDHRFMAERPDFYTKDRSGRVIPPNPDWSDVADLDYANPALRQYMINMLKSWLKDYDIDGFRCDVAFEVPTDFWEQARKELEAQKPGIFLLAEANSPDLLVNAFHADYAWPFQGALNDVLMAGAPASRVRQVWEEQKARFPKNAQHLYFSDNHDEKRAIARFGEKAASAAAALVFGLDGIPLVYNGQEIGDTTESGAPALFEKLPIVWQMAERRPDHVRFFKRIIALRHNHAALRRGALAWIPNSDEDRVLTFLRRSPDQEVLVAINLSSRPFQGILSLDPDLAPGFQEITPSLELNPDDRTHLQATPLPRLDLPPWAFRFFTRPLKTAPSP
jgi:glycosidase